MIIMVIDIAAGSHYSQLKLIHQTNRFFSEKKRKCFYEKTLTSKDSNYIICIKKKSIQIILSTKSTNEDYKHIKKYIEKLFANKSIGIYSKQDVFWLEDIQNVTINQYIGRLGAENE